MTPTHTKDEKTQIANIAHAARRFADSHAEFEEHPEGYTENLAALMDAVLSFGDEDGKEYFGAEAGRLAEPSGYLLTYSDDNYPAFRNSVTICGWTPASWLAAQRRDGKKYHLLNVLTVYDRNEFEQLAEGYSQGI